MPRPSRITFARLAFLVVPLFLAACANMKFDPGLPRILQPGPANPSSAYAAPLRPTSIALNARCDSSAIPVAPTMLEPSDPRVPGWYVDSMYDGAQMSMINQSRIPGTHGRRMSVAEITRLKAGHPDIYRLMNLAYMPNLSDVALLARLARLQGSQGVDSPEIFTEAENRGHALARALDASPADGKSIEDTVQAQRENLNGDAARAVAGDAAAMASLAALADRTMKTEVGRVANIATQAYSMAVHCMRMRAPADNNSHNAFWILKTPSFEAGLGHAAVVAMGSRRPYEVLQRQAGLPGDPDAMTPNTKAGCFPLERGTWAASEVAAWGQECSANPKPRVAEIGPCLSPVAFKTMSDLATLALRDGALVTVLQIRRQMGEPALLGFEVIGVENAASQPSGDGRQCTAVAKPVYAATGGSAPIRGPAQLARATVYYGIELPNDRDVTFKLAVLMGTRLSRIYTTTAAVK